MVSLLSPLRGSPRMTARYLAALPPVSVDFCQLELVVLVFPAEAAPLIAVNAIVALKDRWILGLLRPTSSSWLFTLMSKSTPRT
ncbi:hypothetical protein [Labrys monachus]|uniref:Uncharacterized protein n=1 Tax=Labrys monachus TaxID=217067 RepID=A0ABU0FMJ7_9HYPH|nr:hypothetical protein [Labrys monachus]MDQ0395313.1 hypothetical protein [Labrys monachus]